MKCIAIDDEPVALSIIRQFCQRSGDIELSVFTDPVEGLKRIKEMQPELVFLDIEMGGINGLDVAGQLPAGTFLVFTTAYAEFAVDGFNLDAVDFLHKPFSYSRFERALEKVKRLQELQRLQARPVFLRRGNHAEGGVQECQDTAGGYRIHRGNGQLCAYHPGFRQAGVVSDHYESGHGPLAGRPFHADSQVLYCSLA